MSDKFRGLSLPFKISFRCESSPPNESDRIFILFAASAFPGLFVCCFVCLFFCLVNCWWRFLSFVCLLVFPLAIIRSSSIQRFRARLTKVTANFIHTALNNKFCFFQIRVVSELCCKRQTPAAVRRFDLSFKPVCHHHAWIVALEHLSTLDKTKDASSWGRQ